MHYSITTSLAFVTIRLVGLIFYFLCCIPWSPDSKSVHAVSFIILLELPAFPSFLSWIQNICKWECTYRNGFCINSLSRCLNQRKYTCITTLIMLYSPKHFTTNHVLHPLVYICITVKTISNHLCFASACIITFRMYVLCCWE